MKLVTRLTAGFLAVVVLVISLHEHQRLRQELADFAADLDRTHSLVAATLADAVELVVSRDGLEAALQSVELAAQRHAGDVRIRWVCLPGREVVPPPPLPCATLTTAAGPLQVAPPRADGPPRRYTFVPVAGAAGPLGAIEVSEAPEHEGAWAKQHFNQALLLALMVVAGVTLAAFVLGWWLVAKPTRALVEKARSVGRGELHPDVQVTTGDEFETLAVEMNSMSRRLEAARLDAEAEMAKRVATVEHLRHADRLASVGRLASGLAHELGTPLNVVEARAGLILDDGAAGEAAKASARVIVQCAEQMARLVRQLLALAGARSVEWSPVRLDGLARSVVELVRPLAHARKVSLAAGALAEVTARADAVLLQQALTNLVMNAVHACAQGGHVTLEVAAVQAARRGEAEARRWLELRVIDDGVGLTPEVRARLFEPFFTTKPTAEGTGLGLPIAASIVEDLGGVLDVESTPGKGSTFTISLPEPTP